MPKKSKVDERAARETVTRSGLFARGAERSERDKENENAMMERSAR